MSDAGDSVPRRLAEALIGVMSWDRAPIQVGVANPGLTVALGDELTVLGSIVRAQGGTTVYGTTDAPDAVRAKLVAILASSGFEPLAFGAGDFGGFVSPDEESLVRQYVSEDVAIGVQVASDRWGTLVLLHLQQGDIVAHMKQHRPTLPDDVPMPRLQLPPGTSIQGGGRSGVGDRGSLATIRFSASGATVDDVHIALVAPLPAQRWTELVRTGAEAIAVSCHSRVDAKGTRWVCLLSVMAGDPWLASMHIAPTTKTRGAGAAYEIDTVVVPS